MSPPCAFPARGLREQKSGAPALRACASEPRGLCAPRARAQPCTPPALCRLGSSFEAETLRFEKVTGRCSPFFGLLGRSRRHGRIPLEILAQVHPWIGPGVNFEGSNTPSGCHVGGLFRPRRLQETPKRPPRRLNISPRRSKRQPRGLKTAQERSKRGDESPETASEAP